MTVLRDSGQALAPIHGVIEVYGVADVCTKENCEPVFRFRLLGSGRKGRVSIECGGKVHHGVSIAHLKAAILAVEALVGSDDDAFSPKPALTPSDMPIAEDLA